MTSADNWKKTYRASVAFSQLYILSFGAKFANFYFEPPKKPLK